MGIITKAAEFWAEDPEHKWLLHDIRCDGNHAVISEIQRKQGERMPFGSAGYFCTFCRNGMKVEGMV